MPHQGSAAAGGDGVGDASSSAASFRDGGGKWRIAAFVLVFEGSRRKGKRGLLELSGTLETLKSLLRQIL